MIPRYEVKELSHIWSDRNKFDTYLRVELAILRALEGKKIPKGISRRVAERAVIDPQRIAEIEKITKHDIIAFCTSITENLDPEAGKYFHYGVTSSDIIDTCVTLQLKESLRLVITALREVKKTLLKRSQEFKNTLTLGRSHGMYAEPLSLGQKFLGFYAEFSRRFDELNCFFENQLTGQFSGAVGNYTILTPEIEQEALENLELKVEPLSTQILPRDRIAKLVSINGLLASAIERISVEIRHLHRSEVAELHEGFAKGQKGSSTMPHKKNPISAENLTGMARLIRSHTQIALENIVLWHERDISHSSTERLYLPDHFGILLYSLRRLNSTIENLDIHTEVMEKRVKETNAYLSSYYLHILLDKTDKSREELYKIVQQAAFSGDKSEVFHKKIVSNAKAQGIDLSKLPNLNFQEIKNIYTKHVNYIFARVLKEYPCEEKTDELQKDS